MRAVTGRVRAATGRLRGWPGVTAAAASRRLPRPAKSDASLDERLLGYDYDGSAESSMG